MRPKHSKPTKKPPKLPPIPRMHKPRAKRAAAVISAKPDPDAAADKRAPYARAAPDFWAVCGGTEYALHDAATVDAPWIARLREAASDAWRIFAKTASLAKRLERSVLLEMGFTPLSLRLLRDDRAELPSFFARIDLVETADGFKVLELNAETPFFWVETHVINGLACAQAGLEDPNATCERDLVAKMRAIARDVPQTATVAVTGSNVYREDFFTAAFLAAAWTQALERETLLAPLHELHATANGLYAGDHRIDVLHRCYPLEHFTADRGGAQLVRLVESGNLTLINPGSALFLQNKLTQALIWALYERKAFFEREER